MHSLPLPKTIAPQLRQTIQLNLARKPRSYNDICKTEEVAEACANGHNIDKHLVRRCIVDVESQPHLAAVGDTITATLEHSGQPLALKVPQGMPRKLKSYKPVVLAYKDWLVPQEFEVEATRDILRKLETDEYVNLTVSDPEHSPVPSVRLQASVPNCPDDKDYTKVAESHKELKARLRSLDHRGSKFTHRVILTVSVFAWRPKFTTPVVHVMAIKEYESEVLCAPSVTWLLDHCRKDVQYERIVNAGDRRKPKEDQHGAIPLAHGQCLLSHVEWNELTGRAVAKWGDNEQLQVTGHLPYGVDKIIIQPANRKVVPRAGVFVVPAHIMSRIVGEGEEEDSDDDGDNYGGRGDASATSTLVLRQQIGPIGAGLSAVAVDIPAVVQQLASNAVEDVAFAVRLHRWDAYSKPQAEIVAMIQDASSAAGRLALTAACMPHVSTLLEGRQPEVPTHLLPTPPSSNDFAADDEIFIGIGTFGHKYFEHAWRVEENAIHLAVVDIDPLLKLLDVANIDSLPKEVFSHMKKLGCPLPVTGLGIHAAEIGGQTHALPETVWQALAFQEHKRQNAIVFSFDKFPNQLVLSRVARKVISLTECLAYDEDADKIAQLFAPLGTLKNLCCIPAVIRYTNTRSGRLAEKVRRAR